MKISNYKRTEKSISYTLTVLGITKEIEHEQIELGHVNRIILDDFLETVELYSYDYADMIKRFVELQDRLLMYDIPFEWGEPE